MLRVGLRTMTRKLQLLVLPQASVATAVTVLVVSRMKRLPEAGVDVTVTELHVSVAPMDQMAMTVIAAPQGIPFVAVFITVTVTLVQQQVLVSDDDTKVQFVPHCTVLLEAQTRVRLVAGVMVTI